MTDLWQQVMDSARTAMAAVWTEATANGFWDGQQALKRHLATQLVPPYGVIDMTDLPASGSYGVANRAYEKQLSIYYIGRNQGDSEAIMERLLALNEYLDTHPLTVGQFIPVNLTPIAGNELEPNSLLILLDATLQAGALRGNIVAGTPTLKTSPFAWNPH